MSASSWRSVYIQLCATHACVCYSSGHLQAQHSASLWKVHLDLFSTDFLNRLERHQDLLKMRFKPFGMPVVESERYMSDVSTARFSNFNLSAVCEDLAPLATKLPQQLIFKSICSGENCSTSWLKPWNKSLRPDCWCYAASVTSPNPMATIPSVTDNLKPWQSSMH